MQLPVAALSLMRAQHGLVTRRQLSELRCSLGAVDAMVARGALERVYRAVYRWPGSACPPEQRLLAAVLRCGAGARICGGAASGLQRLEGFDLDEPVEVLVTPGRRVRGVTFAVRAGHRCCRAIA